MRRLHLLFVSLAACSQAGLLAKDTVVLVNGDRLTGAVQRLENGSLTIATDLMGTVRVAWSKVASIRSESSFSVLTEDGERVDGALSKSGGSTSVTRDGEVVRSLDSREIARLARGVGRGGMASLLNGLDGAADIGYSLARGNQNQMQSALGARAAYESAQYKLSGRLDSLFARQDGARSQSRHALNARMERFVNARTFTYGLAGFERNERRSLDLRSRLGGGLGWRIRRSRRTQFSVLGGFAYVSELFRRESSRATWESFLGIEWDTTLYRGVKLSTHLTVHPDLLDRSNVRAELDSGLRVPIAGRFTYSLRLFDRYHTEPARGIERNDYGLVSGVGVKF